MSLVSSYRKDGNTKRIATIVETQLLSMTDKTWKTHIRNSSGLVKTEKVVKLADKAVRPAF